MKVTLENTLTTKENKFLNTIDDNNYGIPDTICQIIINKIISKVVSQSRNNLIYSKINSHCFDFIMNFIDPFLSTDFIFHEHHSKNDIRNSETENQNIDLNFSKIHQNISNTWVEIFEPDTPELDRYNPENIKIVKEEKNNNKGKEANNLVDNDNKEIKPINNKPRRENKLNTLKESLELESHLNNKNESNEENKKNEEKENIRDNNKSNTKKYRIKEQREKTRKNTKNLIIDLPCYDIPKEVYENKYITLNSNEENNLLRIEMEREIINREQQKNFEMIKNKKEYEKKIKIKFTKEFDSNKITFDSNGNIINLNIPNIDSFSNEFYISKPIITNLEVKTTSSNLENGIKGLKNKFIKYLSGNIIPPNKKENDLIKPVIKENNINLTKKISKKINYISKIKIINPSLSLNSILNHRKAIKIEYNQKEKEEKKSNKKIKIPPSGSNFENIIPEVGVIIKNNQRNQTKEGGFAYYNKYKKPSVNEYNQLVIETLKLNQLTSSLTSISNKNETMKLNENNSEYNGYNQEFFDNNNPLIQNAVTSSSNHNKSLMKNKNLFHSVENKKINNIKLISNSFDKKTNNTIKLKKNILEPNLYQYLTKNNIEDENFLEDKEGISNKNVILKSLKKRSFSNLYKSTDEIITNNNNNKIYSFSPGKKINILRNKIGSLPNIRNKNMNKNNVEFIGEDIIDNFNSKILKNRNWGDYLLSERNNMENTRKEIKNTFRKQFKLKKSNELKELLFNRKRVPHVMNLIHEKNKIYDI